MAFRRNVAAQLYLEHAGTASAHSQIIEPDAARPAHLAHLCAVREVPAHRRRLKLVNGRSLIPPGRRMPAKRHPAIIIVTASR